MSPLYCFTLEENLLVLPFTLGDEEDGDAAPSGSMGEKNDSWRIFLVLMLQINIIHCFCCLPAVSGTDDFLVQQAQRRI